MNTPTKAPSTDKTDHLLSLPEEVLLMLLNEENGYFYQVPGWHLNCAIVGAVIAELSLISRIDTDTESLWVIDQTATGNPVLDPILEEIAAASTPHKTQFWIERLANRAEDIIDMTLDRLVELKVLKYHDGDFWTLSKTDWQTELSGGTPDVSIDQDVRTRISRVIFNNEIPDPRDVMTISLINTCDVFRFIFDLDDVGEERIHFISGMDVISRSIADAVAQNIAGPLLRRSALSRKIPKVSLTRSVLSRHFRHGNIPALFADLAQEYGPVFAIDPPFVKPMIFLAGPNTNRWVHRQGRMHLRAKDYFSDFEKVYGASGVMPSLDGADHFRMRKSMSAAYSRGRLEGQLNILYHHARKHMSGWTVGESLPATRMSRLMINEQLSPLFISVDSQDVIDDLIKYKERALMVHIMKMMPKFMLNTPSMKRRAKAVDTLLERVQSTHTPAQRADAPRDLADDWLSLHTSDPQFVPETTLRFQLAAALIASVYLGDALSFAIYAMASQPELYGRIQDEADALFSDGDPAGEEFNLTNIDVTHRFLMECLRMYPIVPMSIRNVMNSCVVEDYELPVGSRLFIATTASHYMSDVFPDPFTFDIDRYLPPRNEHHSPGYAPYGLGTHTCLGSQWMNLQLAANVLMIAHHFNIKVDPENYKLGFNPIPSMKPNRKLKFRIAEKRREISV